MLIDILLWLVVFIILLFLIKTLRIQYQREQMLWNGGTCRICKRPWEETKTKSLYRCACGNYMWRTWKH